MNSTFNSFLKIIAHLSLICSEASSRPKGSYSKTAIAHHPTVTAALSALSYRVKQQADNNFMERVLKRHLNTSLQCVKVISCLVSLDCQKHKMKRKVLKIMSCGSRAKTLEGLKF